MGMSLLHSFIVCNGIFDSISSMDNGQQLFKDENLGL